MAIKKLLLISLTILVFQHSYTFVVHDPINAALNKAIIAENITQTGKLVQEVANGTQTAANTLSQIQILKRNLEHFADWQNLGSFSALTDKLMQASDVGSSLGVATNGIANGLKAMAGDKYSSINSLADTLVSSAAVLDQQASDMSKQNRAYDQISQGLGDKSLDGAVAVMQGNANLLNAIAQQNQNLGEQMNTLNKVQLAHIQDEVNQKNIQEQLDNEYSQSSLAGLLDYKDQSTFDFTKTPKYTY